LTPHRIQVSARYVLGSNESLCHFTTGLYEYIAAEPSDGIPFSELQSSPNSGLIKSSLCRSTMLHGSPLIILGRDYYSWCFDIDTLSEL
jgi:hypothetical protein